MIGYIFVAIGGTTQSLSDCVKKRAAAHTVWAGDLKVLNFDFIARSMSAVVFRHLVFVEIVFFHQPIGEAQSGFGLSLRRIRVISPLKNRTNFVSNVVQLSRQVASALSRLLPEFAE